MGYDTEFRGGFELDKPLSPEHKEYLTKFSETRRFSKKAERFSDPIREKVGLPYGSQGCYSLVDCEDVLDYNCPPEGQPVLWCHWVPNDDGTEIVWDEGEKFYGYVTWLEYLIAHFLKPWGYVLNGECDWRGEGFYDLGTIIVKDNVVISKVVSFI